MTTTVKYEYARIDSYYYYIVIYIKIITFI